MKITQNLMDEKAGIAVIGQQVPGVFCMPILSWVL